MENSLFTTTNPLGIQVSLLDHTWNHIIDRSGHTEVDLASVKYVIENPKLIAPSLDSKNAHYTELHAGIAPMSKYPNLNMNVLVKHLNEGEAIITTAYFNKKFNRNKWGESVYEKSENEL
jgi:hypothetical protein